QKPRLAGGALGGGFAQQTSAGGAGKKKVDQVEDQWKARLCPFASAGFAQSDEGGPVDAREAGQQIDQRGIGGQPVEMGEPDCVTDRAASQYGQRVGRYGRGSGGGKCGAQIFGRERGEPEFAAARADCGQEPRRLMRDEQQRGAGGGFLQLFEQRVGGGAVQFVRR